MNFRALHSVVRWRVEQQEAQSRIRLPRQRTARALFIWIIAALAYIFTLNIPLAARAALYVAGRIVVLPIQFVFLFVGVCADFASQMSRPKWG